MASDIENYRLQLIRQFERENSEAEQAIAENREKQQRAKEAIARCMVEPPAPDSCPECWYMHGKVSPLKTTDSDDEGVDVFRCSVCWFLDRRPG